MTTSGPLLVVDTFVLAPRGEAGLRYEIHLAPDDGRDASRLIFRTDDLLVYRRALDREGTSFRVRVTYHREGRALVLDRLEALDLLPLAEVPS